MVIYRIIKMTTRNQTFTGRPLMGLMGRLRQTKRQRTSQRTCRVSASRLALDSQDSRTQPLGGPFLKLSERLTGLLSLL